LTNNGYNFDAYSGLQYYASETHATQAWYGIIQKIAHLLGPLTQVAPIVGTREERERRLNGIILSKRSLIEYCMTEASNLLSVQKFQLAIPGAIQALKFSKDVYGEKSVEVVEPYLLLAQAFLGMRRLKEAEDYLSLGKWNVLNAASCPDRILSQMHQLLGRLSVAQGHFDIAKSEFASSIFYSSRCYGAEAIATSPGYFRLGDTFLAQNNVENALAFFDKVVDIWYKYLSALHSSTETNNNNNNGYTGNNHRSSQSSLSERLHSPGVDSQHSQHGQQTGGALNTPGQLTEDQLADGRQQLDQILESRRRLLGDGHIATGEIQYTIGLFEFFLLGNENAADSMILSALRTYEQQLGPAHPSTTHVNAVLTFVREKSMQRASQYGGALQQLGSGRGLDTPIGVGL